jgi:hypothetical protein
LPPPGLLFWGCGSGTGEEPSGGEILRRFQIRLATYSFEKSRQLVKNIRRKRESPIRVQEMQPKLQPALLRLSAIISQYFIGSLPFSSPDEFPTLRNREDGFCGLIFDL